MKYIAIGLIFIVISIVVKFFPNVISGYNTLSQNERQSSAKRGFPKFFSFILCMMGVASILSYLISIWLDTPSIAKNALVISVLIGAITIVVSGKLLISNNNS
ncbi:DUF3784 domain-containing protein [Algoriphagus sp.]|uniref:DUF3784 domain-containing protein n=1 Tax=Algoriphagus sp. TaxID=1872435 RepID=UPI003F6FD9DB